MKDFGYDISDFTDIDPIFGTLADFKSLLEKAHEKGLKIVLDFVPNHSSDEHEWFVKSVAREEPYTDYYVWVDPKGVDENGNPIPPNNWVNLHSKVRTRSVRMSHLEPLNYCTVHPAFIKIRENGNGNWR